MAKRNQVQFQKGMSITMFLKDFGTEEKYLKRWRSCDGPRDSNAPPAAAGSTAGSSTGTRGQCAGCGRQTSITAGTLFEHTKLPLATWFQVIFLITQGKKGISAMDLMRKIGVSYNAVWRMKHKIMQTTMEREDEKPLAGQVEVDDVDLGGVRESKRRRGAEGKMPFLADLETIEDWLPRRIKLQEVTGFRLKAIKSWCCWSVASGSKVYSDGLPCFGAVATAGCLHAPVVTGGGKTSVHVKEFVWLNTVIDNVKTAMRNTYHSMKGKYAQRYLSEFEYWFNRRYDLPSMVPCLAWAAARQFTPEERESARPSCRAQFRRIRTRKSFQY